MKGIINLGFVLTVFVVLTVPGVGISQATDPFSKHVISGSDGPGTGKNLVVIVVNAGVYNSITTEIAQYAADIQSDGFRTVIEVVSGGTPEDFRNEIKTQITNRILLSDFK